MCGCSNGNDCGGLTCGEGVAGLNGLNAFTVTTGDFTQPAAVNTPVAVDVSALGQYSGSFAGIGQHIFIEGGGIYVVTAKTPTVLTVEIPDATTLAFNHAVAGAGSTVVFPANVSPSGPIGPQGLPGAAGAAGVNGALVLFKRLLGTPATTTVYANLLAGTNGITANRWQNVGDTVRVSFLAVGLASTGSTPATIGGPAGDRVEFDYRLRVGGVTCAEILGGSMVTPLSSIIGQNGLSITIDLIAINMNPFTLAVHFKDVAVGPGVYNGTSYLVGAIPSYPLSVAFETGDPSATVTGIDPTVLNIVEIEGRHSVIGTGGGASGQQAVPYAMAELFRIQ